MGVHSLAELVRMADTVKNRTESVHPGAFVIPTDIFSGQLGRKLADGGWAPDFDRR
jgi:hypothetical protein